MLQQGRKTNRRGFNYKEQQQQKKNTKKVCV